MGPARAVPVPTSTPRKMERGEGRGAVVVISMEMDRVERGEGR